MYSIYHFFKDLVLKKDLFTQIAQLEDFPFEADLLACQNAGQFPDLAIRLCTTQDLFTGGELIELKDSDSYTVSSFNSTIPTGKKAIEKIIKSENSAIKHQMEQAGDDKKYPEILDNTLNLVLPYHQEDDRTTTLQRMAAVFTAQELSVFQEIKLKHHFNGYFTVFQAKL